MTHPIPMSAYRTALEGVEYDFQRKTISAALDELEAAREQIRALRDALESTFSISSDDPTRPVCPRCHHFVDEHSPETCEVAAALSTPTDGSAG